jgi:hypothetical protein
LVPMLFLDPPALVLKRDNCFPFFFGFGAPEPADPARVSLACKSEKAVAQSLRFCSVQNFKLENLLGGRIDSDLHSLLVKFCHKVDRACDHAVVRFRFGV